MVITPQYEEANQFSDGMAAVRIDDKWGFIDPSGTMIINPVYDTAGRFSEGLAAVEFEGKFGFVDKQGKEVIKPTYDDADLFSEGLARVKIGESYGDVDKKGAIAISPRFQRAQAFDEGLAVIKISDKHGYIDQKGAVVIDCQFDDAAAFHFGLAPVRKGDKWGFYIFTEESAQRGLGVGRQQIDSKVSSSDIVGFLDDQRSPLVESLASTRKSEGEQQTEEREKSALDDFDTLSRSFKALTRFFNSDTTANFQANQHGNE